MLSLSRLNCRLPCFPGGLGGREAFTKPPSQAPVSDAEVDSVPCTFPELIIPRVRCRKNATFDEGPSIVSATSSKKRRQMYRRSRNPLPQLA